MAPKASKSGKITFDTVREIASTLPRVEESTSYGTPSFKIDGRLLTCMAINKSAEPNSLGLAIDFDPRISRAKLRRFDEGDLDESAQNQKLTGISHELNEFNGLKSFNSWLIYVSLSRLYALGVR
jgi:hypothetical protein